jgi:hypothetical protein
VAAFAKGVDDPKGGEMAYKVFVDLDEDRVHSNSLEFDTVEDAEKYARDLFSRWLVPTGWYVIETDLIHVDKSVAEERAVSRG